jgi:hypothetical protein
LIYLRARYYDPATAQFVSVDPRGEVSGVIYEYANDDPLATGDPTGLEALGEGVLGQAELVAQAAGLRQLAALFYAGGAAIGTAFKDAGKFLSITPDQYAGFVLKWAIYLEKVAETLKNRKSGAAIAYFLYISGFCVKGYNLPTHFRAAYCWFRGINRKGGEIFWCGDEGWIVKANPNLP